MKLPFPSFGQSLTASITVHGDIGDDGAPAVVGTATISCSFEQNVKTIRSPEGEATKSLSRAIIKGDVAGLNQKNKGNFTLDGKLYKIEEVRRFFDLDNSVHHLELLVV